jgi:hypothetical protein
LRVREADVRVGRLRAAREDALEYFDGFTSVPLLDQVGRGVQVLIDLHERFGIVGFSVGRLRRGRPCHVTERPKRLLCLLGFARRAIRRRHVELPQQVQHDARAIRVLLQQIRRFMWIAVEVVQLGNRQIDVLLVSVQYAPQWGPSTNEVVRHRLEIGGLGVVARPVERGKKRRSLEGFVGGRPEGVRDRRNDVDVSCRSVDDAAACRSDAGSDAGDDQRNVQRRFVGEHPV